MRKLTIGMCVYSDFDGIYFTIQSMRLSNPDVMDQVEFVIINNNPQDREHTQAIKNYINHIEQPVQYFEVFSKKGTAVRSKIFDVADTPYVLVVDSHVLLEPGTIGRLIDFYDKKYDKGNLIQGPLMYDDMKNISTHMDHTWRSLMWGTWQTIDNFESRTEPFEIPAHGLGLFSCRKECWLGFHPLFEQFGGEEVYIHKKYKKAGKKTLCVPWLKWVHRFGRPNGVPYNMSVNSRFNNYYYGIKEAGNDQDIEDLISHFVQETSASREHYTGLCKQCDERLLDMSDRKLDL